jgi:hypothetical protein
LLGTLFDWVRDVKSRIFCRSCEYKTYFALGVIKHLKKCHNSKPTKKDLKFLLKYNFVTRLVKCLVACVLIPPLFLLKLICYVFEIIGNII